MTKEEINIFKSHKIWRLIVDAIESDTQIMTAKLVKATSIDDVRKYQGCSVDKSVIYNHRGYYF